jgi:IS5 family transposase
MPEVADTADFFRPRLSEMIDLRHPLAVLASRLPWAQIEAALPSSTPTAVST